jgi:Domain of unknown function (DUF4105)
MIRLKRTSTILGYIFLGFIAALLLLYLFASFKTAKNDRDWDPTVKILPKIQINKNIVEAKDLRDIVYEGKDKVKSISYYNDTFDTNKIKKVYFLLNPFVGHPSFAHTFFVFDFGAGKSVSVSVEARKEVGESYSTVKGLMNNFEVAILWGSERDFVARRSVYFDESLYRYDLDISTTTARGLFIDLANETNKVQETPRFYNTLTENCTNILADSANRVNKDSIPWNSARIFTGFADRELYDLGLIRSEGRDFLSLKEGADITPRVKDLYLNNTGLTRSGFTMLLESL